MSSFEVDCSEDCHGCEQCVDPMSGCPSCGSLIYNGECKTCMDAYRDEMERAELVVGGWDATP